MSIFVGEIGQKGLLTQEYQTMILNFVIMWYFVSSFLVQSFAVLYYRKYREH